MEIDLGDFQKYIHNSVDSVFEQIFNMSYHGLPFNIINIEKGRLVLSRPIKIRIDISGTEEEIEELLIRLIQQNLVNLDIHS